MGSRVVSKVGAVYQLGESRQRQDSANDGTPEDVCLRRRPTWPSGVLGLESDPRDGR